MVNIAVVGAGKWGKNLVRVFSQLGVLYAVCDVDTKYSFQDILDNTSIGGVVIATPNQCHYPMAKEALLNYKDVFVEKPMTTNIQEAEELVELAKAMGRILMTGQIMLYHPAIIDLKRQIDAGELGEIESIYSVWITPGRDNIVWRLAPHPVSISLFLWGKCERNSIIIAGSNSYKERRVVVVGSKGRAVFDGQAPPKVEPLLLECQDFMDCIETRKQPKANGEDAIEVIRTIVEQYN
jgi:UDP-2-acetamido-3-amino-2,3-dideoxy-glucuronate N-acetyltransferase